MALTSALRGRVWPIPLGLPASQSTQNKEKLKFSGKPCLKNEGGEQKRETPSIFLWPLFMRTWAYMSTHILTCACIHMYTYAHSYMCSCAHTSPTGNRINVPLLLRDVDIRQCTLASSFKLH